MTRAGVAIIFFTDSDGDDVAVDAAAICAVTLGRLQRPIRVDGIGDGDPHLATLIHTAAGPLVVSQAFDRVVTAWQTALAATAVKRPAHQHQHQTVAQTSEQEGEP